MKFPAANKKNPPIKMSGLKFINITVQKLAFNVPDNRQSYLALFQVPATAATGQDIGTGTCDREPH
ncbi:hypothetical protein A3860_19355 [Niastella vici]|uniref:Uncharacterized protein n=1 Tax=Niastella vici TaxID=1703345 RepID=A0A1V9G2V2_9BACT|nr:hypothetical protein A3860_19355 [Niastella vici]